MLRMPTLGGLALAALISLPAQAERYTELCVKVVCGRLEVGMRDGVIETDFSFRDNGRGPDQKEWIRLDAEGQVLSYRTEGVSTFGAKIAEQFERASDGRVSWRSRVDESAPVAAPAGALYLPVEFTAAYLEVLARRLLRQPQSPALPNGSLGIERMHGAKVQGEELGLYAISGYDLLPVYVWLRERDKRLVAQLNPGAGGTILAGLEPAQDELDRLQRAVSDGHLGRLARQLTHALPGLTVIQNVRWFDSQAAVMRGPSDVFLHDGRIAFVRAPGSLARLDVSQRIDGRGRTLLPGLVDMHAHVEANQMLLNLAAGVTAVRDVGNVNAKLWDIKQRIDRGELLGPRIAANGFIEGKSPFSSQADFVPDTLDEALAAIDWYAAHGYRQLKLYNSIRPEWVKPMCERAAQLGLRVGGHVPAFMTAAQAVQGGYRELHHINQVTLNFLVSQGDDTRTLLRFTLPGERAGELKLNDRRTRDFLALLKRTGTVVDPTAVAFEAMYLQRQGQMNPSYAAIAPHLPASLQRAFKSAEMEVDAQKAPRYAASWKVMMALTRRMFAAGIPLVAGTDATPGFAMQRELELYAEAGIPVAQVLKIATWNGAKHSDRLAEIGSIERGKLADLVLVDGDPLERLADIRQVALVIKGGVAYAPDEIYAAMGILPFVPAARIEAP